MGIAGQSIVKPFLINKVEVGNENGWNGVSLGCSLVGARLFCDRGLRSNLKLFFICEQTSCLKSF